MAPAAKNLNGVNVRNVRYVPDRTDLIDYAVPDFGGLWAPDLTVLPNGWAVALAEITPELAAAMLGTNVDNNRKLIHKSVERFAVDMQAGKWRLTHQGIAFNRLGKLHDGQNRLTAVVDSGTTVPMTVWFGAGADDEMTVIDTGKQRSGVDAANVLRLDADRHIGSVVCQVYKYARPNRNFNVVITNSLAVELIRRYGDQARTVNGWFGGKQVRGVDRVPIRAAVLAALVCGQDPVVLERFADVLCDKLPATEPGDSAATFIRRFIINNLKGGISGAVVGADLFLRTAQAILHAVDRREVKLVRAPGESPFVIPENA